MTDETKKPRNEPALRWQRENKISVREYARNWRNANREYLRQYAAEWSAARKAAERADNEQKLRRTKGGKRYGS